MCGVALPEGLVEASQLPDPIFTPASKAELGEHDENISFEAVVDKVGQDLAVKLRDDTLDVYGRASNFAADRGIILADTKLEFGLDPKQPDSRRRGPHPRLVPVLAGRRLRGREGAAELRQAVRPQLAHRTESGWDRASDTPPPPLPAEIVEATRERYIERTSGSRVCRSRTGWAET